MAHPTALQQRCTSLTMLLPLLLLLSSTLLETMACTGTAAEWNEGAPLRIAGNASSSSAVAVSTTPVDYYFPLVNATMEHFLFSCEFGDIAFQCVTARVVGTTRMCYGVDLRTEDGVTYSGSSGFSPCALTGCRMMFCAGTTYTIVSQSILFYDNNRLGSCTCLKSLTEEELSLRVVSYTPESPNYPSHDYQCQMYESCPVDADGLTGRLVYDSEEDVCKCSYPFSAVNKEFSVNRTATPSDTPNPDVPGDPSTTVAPTTLEPMLVAASWLQNICLSIPSYMPLAVLTAHVDEVCCTVFTGINSSVKLCGTSIENAPTGLAYCRSSITNYEFCCVVDIMSIDAFAYRGSSCLAPENAAAPTRSSFVALVATLSFALLVV